MSFHNKDVTPRQIYADKSSFFLQYSLSDDVQFIYVIGYLQTESM